MKECKCKHPLLLVIPSFSSQANCSKPWNKYFLSINYVQRAELSLMETPQYPSPSPCCKGFSGPEREQAPQGNDRVDKMSIGENIHSDFAHSFTHIHSFLQQAFTAAEGLATPQPWQRFWGLRKQALSSLHPGALCYEVVYGSAKNTLPTSPTWKSQAPAQRRWAPLL